MPPPARPRCSTDCKAGEHRNLQPFCELGPEAADAFDAIGVPVTLPKGAVFFDEDEPSRYVYVVCTGQVKLSCVSKDGRTLILKIAMPGDLLGLSAVLSGARYEVTAEALTPARVKQMPAAEFTQWMERFPEAGMHAAKALSAEYRSAYFDARRLALAGSAAGRLGSILLEWGLAAKSARPEMRFTMALTHEDLARLAGTSRETVTRTLSQFRRDKLIEIHGSSILILSPENLEALSA